MSAAKMISIAMATYNGEKYLREQLDSILAQTVQDFELIVCDDCSTDLTMQILNEYAERDSRIKVFENEENLGFKKNFEKVIGLCSGNYIALSDQDDIWLPEHLEVLYKNIGEKSTSWGNSLLIDSNGNCAGKKLSEGVSFNIFYDNYNILYRLLFISAPFQGASSLYTKELIESSIPIPNGVNYHDAWLDVSAVFQNGIACTFEPITKYRMHGDNASGQHYSSAPTHDFRKKIKRLFSGERYQTDRIVYCNELLKRFPNCDENAKKIVQEALEFHVNRSQKKHRLKSAFFLIKNYKKIWTTNSYKYLFFRVLIILTRG